MISLSLASPIITPEEPANGDNEETPDQLSLNLTLDTTDEVAIPDSDSDTTSDMSKHFPLGTSGCSSGLQSKQEQL